MINNLAQRVGEKLTSAEPNHIWGHRLLVLL